MSDAKAIKISKLIDYHREIENSGLRLSGDIFVSEIELIKDHHINLGC